MLTTEHIAQFERDGFVKGARVLDAAQVELLQRETLRVIEEQGGAGPRPIQLVNLTGNGEAPVWQIVDIFLASEPFAELVHNAQIAEEIAQLLRSESVRLWHDQIQYKPAQTGGVNPWHQDSPLWAPLTPKDRQITAWVALDDVDEENGCMKMVRGSQAWGDQIGFLNGLREFDAMPQEWNGHEVQLAACPVRAGEVHFHHSLTWHGSGSNLSGRPRRAIALHFMASDTLFSGDRRHPMAPHIHVAAGEPVEGELFPQVWPRA